MTGKISVVIPTCGRASFFDTVVSAKAAGLLPTDEIVAVSDGRVDGFMRSRNRLCEQTGLDVQAYEGPLTRCTGNTQRNIGMLRASGDFLMFMDDDDTYIPDVFTAIREACLDGPDRLHIFRMRYDDGRVLWRTKDLVHGNIGTPMLAVSRLLAKGCVWPEIYAADWAFVTQLRAAGLRPEWHDLVIARVSVASHGRLPFSGLDSLESKL